MAALPSASWLNETNPLWMKDGGTYNNVNISSITTNHMVLDGQGLDATSAAGGTLLINGVALASATGLTSSIANWAQFPALSSIVYTTAGGSGGTINMNVGQFSTLQNLSGSISTLNVSSINGYNANSSGGSVVDTATTYFYSTSNAPSISTTPTQVAGAASGLYTLVVGKKYNVTVPLAGYLGSSAGILYASVSLGTASGLSFPVAFDSSSSAGSRNQEPKMINSVLTATATSGGLYLYVWRGNDTALDGNSIQVRVNDSSTVSGTGTTANGIVITQLT